MNNLFLEESANENNPKWEKMISRKMPLYKKKYDVRSEFERDYNRVIFSTAYRRLKHKTQNTSILLTNNRPYINKI